MTMLDQDLVKESIIKQTPPVITRTFLFVDVRVLCNYICEIVTLKHLFFYICVVRVVTSRDWWLVCFLDFAR